jgi:hypothetical protein
MDPCGRGEGTPSRFARRWRRARRLGTRRLGQARRLDPDRSGCAPSHLDRARSGPGLRRAVRRAACAGRAVPPAARGWVGVQTPPPGGARPVSDPHGFDPLPRPPMAAKVGRVGSAAAKSPAVRPFAAHSHKRANASNPPPPRRLRRASGAGSRPPRRDPLPSPKRPAQPTGRRHTPHQNPMKAAVFGLGPRRDGVALSDPRHPGSSGTAHPSKSRANVRPV